jgi:hypothetical protein
MAEPRVGRRHPLAQPRLRRRDLLWSGSGLLAAGFAPAPSPAAPSPPPPPPPQKGITLPSWWHDLYRRRRAERALAAIAATGANWVQLVVTAYQTDHRAVRIAADPQRTPADADLAYAVAAARAQGLRVLLKLHVDLADDPDHWRGDIGRAFRDDSAWRDWFSSYTRFAERYASFARSYAIDQVAVGTELEGTTAREAAWRAVIDAVRRRYPGPLVYAANHGEEIRIGFWDALDLIGVDAYYPLAAIARPRRAELRGAWARSGALATLERLSQAEGNKPILLTEIGYRSVEGAAAAPWDWTRRGRVDLVQQRELYRAAFRALWGRPWLAGMFWWYWDLDPDAGGPADTGYTPQGKPAAALLERWYRR